jgi:hypothetical protein
VEERGQSAGRAGGDQCTERVYGGQRLKRAEQEECPADQGENAERAGRRVAHRGQPARSVSADAEAVGRVGQRILVQGS